MFLLTRRKLCYKHCFHNMALRRPVSPPRSSVKHTPAMKPITADLSFRKIVHGVKTEGQIIGPTIGNGVPRWEAIPHGGKPFPTFGNHYPCWEIIVHRGIPCLPSLQTPIHKGGGFGRLHKGGRRSDRLQKAQRIPMTQNELSGAQWAQQ